VYFTLAPDKKKADLPNSQLGKSTKLQIPVPLSSIS